MPLRRQNDSQTASKPASGLRKWFKGRITRDGDDPAPRTHSALAQVSPNSPSITGYAPAPPPYAGHATNSAHQQRPDYGYSPSHAVDGFDRGRWHSASPPAAQEIYLPAHSIPTFQVQPPLDDECYYSSNPASPGPHLDGPQLDLEGLSPAQLLFVLTALNRSALSVARGDAQQASHTAYEIQNRRLSFDSNSSSDGSLAEGITEDPYYISDTEETYDHPTEQDDYAMLDVPLLERDLNRRCMFMSPAERPHWYIERPLDLPTGHPDFLCGTCRHIDFIKLFEQEETNVLPPRKHYIALGLFAEISAKKECPFCSFACRVIVHHMLIEKNLHRADHEEKKQALLETSLFTESFYICPIRYVHTYHVPLLYFCQESDLPSISRRMSIATKAVRYGLPRTMSFRPMHKTQSRLGRFTPRDTIDFQWIKDRMILCDERSQSRSYQNSPYIRAINVNTLSINTLPARARYCTLSYVWGEASQFTLSKENVRGLQKHGSLKKVMARFPKTIRDAITLVRKIGETYLWVDALCIVQNDDADKAVQIGAMGDIYRQSILCIQAMCGVDATYGLPGVEPNSRSIQQFATRLACSRGNLLLSNQLPNADKDATWRTRAWTLQEKFLSQRMLLITDDSVTWWCWHTQTVEDENCRHEMWPKGTEHTEMYFFTTEHDLIMSKIPKNSNFDIYAFTVFDYTQRNIKYQEDAGRACLGVLNVFAGLHRATCVFGFPDTAWDAALLWCPVGSAVRRLDQHGRPLFPSWSWLGWKGAAAYPWLTEREFPLSTKGSPLLWEDASLRGDARWFTSLEYRHSTSPSGRLTHDPFENWKLDSEDPWVYSTDFQEELRWIHPVTQEQYSGGRRAFNYTVGKSHRLRFVTLSATFELAPDIVRRKENYDYAHPLYQQRIVDRWGFSVGCIYTPDPNTMSEWQRHKFSGRQEFIVLSRTSVNPDPRAGAEQLDHSIYQMPSLRPRNIPPPQSGGENLHDTAYFNVDRYDSSYPWCLFNVLMVEWCGDCVQRVSVGKIHIGAFLSANPTRRNISME